MGATRDVSPASLSSDAPPVLVKDMILVSHLKRLEDRLARRDKELEDLRCDVQHLMKEVFDRDVPMKGRNRSPSLRRDEDTNWAQARERLGYRVAPYDVELLDTPPTRPGARGDPKDRFGLGWVPRHGSKGVESSASHRELSRTASHESEMYRRPV